ncbi:alpha/beta fold hydrolase [Cellulomonas sp. S1-8]|uniref:alpha/beta fold hydrolase n=1 Tax=Cellulomonas sp. S1-8 TaxID=2904790 RepID=UPI0022435BF0|nr:alpha/beta fold hydrolase [Cellulomonas sp. S1-8]UZN04663.1 lysophospholipase [Cellulomonas sp. S1-8]
MPQIVRGPRTGDRTDVRVDRVRIDGLALRTWTVRHAAVDDLAPEDRRDFVLVHGLGASSATYERLTARLGLTGTVHLLDLPGFGGVPRPAGPLGIEELAQLVTRWAERTGVSGATFLGHSMGAQVVVEAIAAAPGLASHAVLIGPTVDDRARTAPEQLVHLARSAVHDSARVQSLLLRGWVECGPRWFGTVLQGMLRHPVAERLREVDVPVLVVRGEHDHVAPPPWVRTLVDAAPRARAVTVPGAGHAPMYEHASEVGDLVLDLVAP